jgi:hypothetical protein
MGRRGLHGAGLVAYDIPLAGGIPEMSLESYWQAFSTDLDAIGGKVLENRNLPILETNAGYPNAPGQILEIKRLYVARGRPACVILPEASNLELEASNAQFVPFAGFALLESESEPEPDWMQWPTIEQVSWAAARSLAQSWCGQVGATGWEASVASEIARVMPEHPHILAYLAFEDSRVIGMGIALEDGLHWLAGRAKTKLAIVKRATFDAGRPLQFSVPLEEVPHFSAMRELERFVIWTESSSR